MTAGASTTAVLARYLRPQGRRLAALAAFLVASILTQLVSPLIVRQFIDTARLGGAHVSLTVLWVLAGIFIAAAIVTQLLQIGATYFSAQLAWAATNAHASRSGEPRARPRHELPHGHLARGHHRAGGRRRRRAGQLLLAVRAADHRRRACCWSASSWCVIAAGLARRRRRWALVAIVAGVTMHAMRNVSRAQWERVRNAFSAFSAFLEERIAGLEDIRANGGGAHVDAALRRAEPRARHHATWRPHAAASGSTWSPAGCSRWASPSRWRSARGSTCCAQVTIGEVFMSMQYAGMMAQPIVHDRRCSCSSSRRPRPA